MSNYVIISVFTLIFLFTFGINESSVVADCSSPVFSRQIDEDRNLPFDYYGESSVTNRPDLDITHVSFFSDGTTLNATIWLDGMPIEKQSSWITYGIAIDSDFNQNTGDVGSDYGYYYEYVGNESLIDPEENIEPGNWYSVVTEFASISRYVEERNLIDISDFSTGTDHTISFSVNLTDIGNCPEKYNLLFYATDYNLEEEYEITDVTRWIEIPFSKFTLSTNPDVLELEAGGEELVEVILENTSALEHKVSFSISEQSNQNLGNLEIELLDQNEKVLSPNSFVTTHINVKAPVTTVPKTTYTVGVSAEIQKSDDLISQYKDDYLLPSAINFSDEELPIMHSTSFSVTILTFLDLVWSSFERIEVIFGTISTVIAVLTIIWKLVKRKKKRESNKPQS